jgi:hypothetical protein
VLSPAIEHIRGCDVAQRLVVPAEDVVVDEVSERPLQLAGPFIGDLIYLLLDGPVIAL